MHADHPQTPSGVAVWVEVVRFLQQLQVRNAHLWLTPRTGSLFPLNFLTFKNEAQGDEVKGRGLN
ncbi:hypothetical protein Hanom_Chr09g00778471 [Helianthus anomalus]